MYHSPDHPGAVPPAYGHPWVPQPPARTPRSRRAVIAIVAACVLGVAVSGAAIAGAVSVGRSVGESIAGQASPPSAPVQPGPPVSPAGLGDDPVLDGYATRCHDGDMQACDDLYDQADPMSRYEEYGMTCGGRVKSFDVNYCTDLG